MDRGKRLARSNIIGEDGELLFRRWALKHQLTANKANQDIGIDFFCQVMAPVSDSTSVEAKGPVLGAQVKTVEDGEDARLVINRIDATDLLRQTQATCLFGIRLSDESVHFQFVDRSFIDRLVAFLDSDNDRFTISYKTLSADSPLFLRLLKRYTNPFEQIQFQWCSLARFRGWKRLPIFKCPSKCSSADSFQDSESSRYIALFGSEVKML